MTDEKPAPNGIKEIAAIHVALALLISLFFRWRAHKDSYWQAGDESLVANAVAGLIDSAYWLIKPRLLKWRNG